MKQVKTIVAKVLCFDSLGADLFTFSVSRPPEMGAVPGQFAMVGVPGHTLRRPISIALDKDGSPNPPVEGEYRFYVRAAGKGTEDLREHVALLKPIELSGPHGNGFPLAGEWEKRRWLLVGGGIGLAPLIGIAARSHSYPPVCVIGSNTIGEAMRWRSIIGQYLSGGNITNAVMDMKNREDFVNAFGAHAFRGNTAEGLADYFAQNPEVGFDVAYVCGPKKMIESVAEVLRKAKIPSFVSLEERMACGVGSCCSCAIPGTDNEQGVPLHVCKDGPVFPMKTILENIRS